MSELKKGILSKGFSIDEKYNVMLFVKRGSNAETYRVRGADGKLYFLKLFYLAKLSRSAFDNNNNVLEIEFLKTISHPNIVSYKDNGEIIVEGNKFVYLVLHFISGETLAERLFRESFSTLYDVKQIVIGVLKGLDYLHSLPDPIIHNEITPHNIMLDLSADIPQSIIIDFGYARSFFQSTKAYNREGLNLNYVASECFNNIYSPQSDLFSIGVVMYQLLFGMSPWFKDISRYQASRINAEEAILEERRQPLKFPNIENRIVDFDDSILNIVNKALQNDVEKRFKSAKEFSRALIEGLPVEEITYEPDPVIVKKGKGFSAIAGMQQLKDQLKSDVIDVIAHPEEYKLHHLGLPNGMLLYGPPGCGKTFFAERFAEEAGYNFMKVISSDIASIYVHGSQEKIGNIFDEARKKAPTILYFDELDAMIPKRDNIHNQSQSSEVNEFLSQLDNIGDSGVFVIGSTNKPDLIDKAALRAGRLEKWFYISPPDFEARKAMFELYLKDRPIALGIDYHKLASLTEHYVSSDIKFLIDETSRKTIRDKEKRISQEILELIINNQKPTISLVELNKYEALRKEIEGNIHERPPRVGFI